MIRQAALLTALLLAPLAAFGQKPADTSWDVFGGVSVVRSSAIGQAGSYNYGWSASVANRPYEAHPWIGGVVEGMGIYSNGFGASQGINYTTNWSMYTAMAGPVVVLGHRGLRPFAHALVGGAIINQTTTDAFGSVQNENDYFVHALGGGLDLPVRHHVLVRAQADWMHVWETNAPNNDMLRLCGGLVWSY